MNPVAPIELYNQFGAIDCARISEQTDAILELPPETQSALSTLIDAAKAREAATARQSAATKRKVAAEIAEHETGQAFADASLPIPFSAAGIPANRLAEARAAHALRCSQYLEQLARNRASGVSDSDGVATLGPDGKWTKVAPEKKTGHAKTKGPSSFKIAKEKADAELASAARELFDATELANRAINLEGTALEAFQKLQKRPSADELLKDAAARSTQQRAANVAKGLPPGGVKVSSAGKSPIDVFASQRGRNSGPLRSNVVRRSVG
jgi:hypothetical protein